MSKPRKKTRWNLIVILIIAGAFSYAGFRYLYPKQSSDIFLVSTPQLTYGDTSLTGVIKQSSGTFLLILEPNLIVELDVQGIDHLLDQQAIVSGNLYLDELGNNKMTVNNIQVSLQ